MIAAADELQAVCHQHRWRYCIIGGLAVLRWGRPRVTRNVDLTTSAEDLVVSKAFASRPQDWLDIQGIAALRNESLDWRQIEDELRPLAELKEEPEILTRLAQVRQLS